MVSVSQTIRHIRTHLGSFKMTLRIVNTPPDTPKDFQLAKPREESTTTLEWSPNDPFAPGNAGAMMLLRSNSFKTYLTLILPCTGAIRYRILINPIQAWEWPSYDPRRPKPFSVRRTLRANAMYDESQLPHRDSSTVPGAVGGRQDQG